MNYHQFPVMSVKFKMPEPRKNYIIRKKIFEKLESLREYKVTIVKAGAGSGKTTLLSSFAKQRKIDNLKWINLDQNMNQAFIFWKYVMEEMGADTMENTGDFLKFFDGNIQKDNLWQILTVFINQLSMDNYITLVLDDFHFIKDKFLIKTIDYFINNLPDNIHLILLSREIPEIYLGTLTMENKLLLIDEEDIRLSEEESREFLLHTLKLDCNEKLLEEIIVNSDGWIGGLQLTSVALNSFGNDMVSGNTLSNRMIDDYISREIFEYLSEEEQEFLIKTSILPYFNAEMCKQYLPGIHFKEIMESIIHKNLFVVNMDTASQVFRFHAIFTDFLNNLFKKRVENKYEIRNQAADIYFQNGDYEESLNQLFACENYEKIMTQLLNMPQTSVTFSYMIKVPLEQIEKNTDFAYQYFFCYYASVDLEACEKIYNFIIKNMKEDTTIEAFKRSDLFFNINWDLKKIHVIPLEQIELMPLNPVTKAYLLIKEAYFLFISRQNEMALEYLEKADEVYKRTGNLYIALYVLAEKTQILEEIGELNEALNLYRVMEEKIKKVPAIAPSYYIGIAGVYIRQLKLQKAKEVLDCAKQLVNKNNFNIYSAYQYTLAEYCYIIGDCQKTEEILTEFAGMTRFDNIVYSARLLRYPVFRGQQKEMAERFVKNYKKSEDILRVMDTEILYAGIMYEAGQIGEAIETAEKVVIKARKAQNKLKIVEGDLLKIRFLYGQRKPTREVINLFLEAVSYASENIIAVPFWFEKAVVKEITEKYNTEIKNKLSKEDQIFLNSVLHMDNNYGIRELENMKYDLSVREMEVLKEMEKGHTNKQIADSLCISVATVKSHIINIYGKLGVNNRVAAINKLKR